MHVPDTPRPRLGAANTDAPEFRITFGDLGLIVLGIAAGILAAAAGGHLSARWIDPQHSMRQVFGGQTIVLAGLSLQAMITVGAVWIFGIRRRGMDWSAVGFRRASLGWIVVATLAAVACMPLVAGVTQAFQALLDRPVSSPQAEVLAPAADSWIGVIGLILLGGLAAPFAEELLFRGVLYPLLRRVWGVSVGAVVSAAVFSVVHGFVDVIPGTFLLGVILALLYERTGSLWVPLTLHAVFNSANFILMFVALTASIEP